jgi:hypothetical protein
MIAIRVRNLVFIYKREPYLRNSEPSRIYSEEKGGEREREKDGT